MAVYSMLASLFSDLYWLYTAISTLPQLPFHYWKSFGNSFQNLWLWLYEDVFLESEWAAVVLCLYVTAILSFVVFSIPFMVADFFQWPSWFAERRIQPGKIFTMDEFWRSIKFVAFNLFFTNYFVAESYYRLGLLRGADFGRETLTFGRFTVDLAFSLCCYEIFFYLNHWVLHRKWLYRYIHKIHHEWTAPISTTVHHEHPIEHGIVLLVAGGSGSLILGSHISFTLLMSNFGLLFGLFSHCGYHVPFQLANLHDYHHETFIYNYGTFGILDFLFGTKKRRGETENFETAFAKGIVDKEGKEA